MKGLLFDMDKWLNILVANDAIQKRWFAFSHQYSLIVEKHQKFDIFISNVRWNIYIWKIMPIKEYIEFDSWWSKYISLSILNIASLILEKSERVFNYLKNCLITNKMNRTKGRSTIEPLPINYENYSTIQYLQDYVVINKPDIH